MQSEKFSRENEFSAIPGWPCLYNIKAYRNITTWTQAPVEIYAPYSYLGFQPNATECVNRNISENWKCSQAGEQV